MSRQINFNTMQSNTEIADGLEQLRQEIAQVSASGTLDAQTESAAQSSLRQAIREVNMPAPSKTTLLEHLESARACLSGNAEVAPLAETLAQASVAVERIP